MRKVYGISFEFKCKYCGKKVFRISNNKTRGFSCFDCKSKRKNKTAKKRYLKLNGKTK